MKISVVIPTYNRLNQLKRTLEHLEFLEFPVDDFEVLVVSDGSTDGTSQYLNDIKVKYQIKPILNQNMGVANARNSGIQAARGELILFIDDDTVPDTLLLSEHYQTHEHNGPDTIVIGPMLAPPDFQMAPWVSWEQSRLLEQYEDMSEGRWLPTPRQFYTANASIARKHLISEGGFDPEFRRAEDVELAYRLEKNGLKFIYNPMAIVYHYAERSFDSWVAVPYAYGINDVIFTNEKKQSWLLPTIFNEYHDRHNLIKILTTLCLDRNSISSIVKISLKNTSLFCDKVGLRELSHLACSGVFNLMYYQGISDKLGGRQAFFSEVHAAKHASLTHDLI